MPQAWTPLHARLHQILRSRHLLSKGQRILVAVSGGQDSLCLIRLLLDLQPKWDWQIAIAHCNHRWRDDAAANADYVEGLAQTWNIPYYGLIATDAQTPDIKTEAGARSWRYQVLTETAIAQGYGAIATGHTASDRAETLLYNLMRGSGTDGLQALTWQRYILPPPLAKGRAGVGSVSKSTKKLKGRAGVGSASQSLQRVAVIRPLLFMTRSETSQFCQDTNLNPWIDSTNNDWHYARNRIRQDLLPYLQNHFNPNVEHNLAQTAEILQADVAYLDTEADKLWEQIVDETNAVGFPPSTQPTSPLQNPKSKIQNPTESSAPLRLKLNRKALALAPLALQRRVLRRCLLQLLPKAPNFDHIEKLTALITAPNRSQTDPFPGGAIARVEGEWIVIESRPNSPSPGE